MDLYKSYKKLYYTLTSKSVDSIQISTNECYYDNTITMNLTANVPIIEYKQISNKNMHEGNFYIDSLNIRCEDNIFKLEDVRLISYGSDKVCYERDMAPIFTLSTNPISTSKYTRIYYYTLKCSKITNIVQKISSSFKK